MRLENQVALISGGARGMGAVEAHMFATEGARVVIGDVLEDEGRQTEASVNEAGGECVFVRLDVTSESDWNAAVATPCLASANWISWLTTLAFPVPAGSKTSRWRSGSVPWTLTPRVCFSELRPPFRR